MTTGIHSSSRTVVFILTNPSLRCIQVIAGVLGRAGEAGQKQRLAAAARGEITYAPAKGLYIEESEETDTKQKEPSRPRKEARASANRSRDEGSQNSEPNPPLNESLEDTEDFARKLDDVNNHESHRTRDGRDIKKSA